MVTPAAITVCHRLRPATKVDATRQTSELRAGARQHSTVIKWDPNFIKPTLVRYIDLTRESKGAGILSFAGITFRRWKMICANSATNMDDTMRSQNAGFITGIQY